MLGYDTDTYTSTQIAATRAAPSLPDDLRLHRRGCAAARGARQARPVGRRARAYLATVQELPAVQPSQPVMRNDVSLTSSRWSTIFRTDATGNLSMSAARPCNASQVNATGDIVTQLATLGPRFRSTSPGLPHRRRLLLAVACELDPTWFPPRQRQTCCTSSGTMSTGCAINPSGHQGMIATDVFYDIAYDITR